MCQRLRAAIVRPTVKKQIPIIQSRLARMEAGDPSVSLDLLVRGLFALGATWKELGKAA